MEEVVLDDHVDTDVDTDVVHGGNSEITHVEEKNGELGRCCPQFRVFVLNCDLQYIQTGRSR